MPSPAPTFTVPHEQNSDEALTFLHIPKTGGVSFSHLLAQHFSRADIHPLPHPDRDTRHSDEGALPLQRFESVAEAHRQFNPRRSDSTLYPLIMGHYSFAIVEPEHMLPLTLLREPIARHLSQIHFAQRTHDMWSPFYQAIRNKPLERIIEIGDFMQSIANMQTLQLAGVAWSPHDHSDPQALLRQAMHNLRRCFFVGLQERFEESLLLLAYSLRWSPIANTVHHNANPAPTRVSDLSPRVHDALRAIANLDLPLYEYAKALYNQRLIYMIEHATLGAPQRSFDLAPDDFLAQQDTAPLYAKKLFDAPLRQTLIDFITAQASRQPKPLASS